MALNKDAFIKLILPSMIVVSIVITIVEELRSLGIIFFALGSIAWFLVLIGKLSFLTKDNSTDRMLKYFIYPTMIFNAVMLFISKDYRDAGAGWIYLIMSTFTLLIYLTPVFRNVIVGIDKKVTKGVSWGVGIAFGFLFISKILPGFSLLTPELPFSLLSGVRGIVIIGFAPILESGFFRGALLNVLKETYGVSFGLANGIQALLFGLYHLAAYGIFLSSLDNLTQLFGATVAIAGSLITAVAFGLIIGYLVKRFNTLLVEIIPHGIINGFLFFTVLSVGTFFSIG